MFKKLLTLILVTQLFGCAAPKPLKCKEDNMRPINVTSNEKPNA